MSSLQQLMTVPGIWFTVTVSIQLFAVSLLGFIAVKAAARRSAPLRSMVAMSAMIALVLTLIGSAFFHSSHISWWTPSVPVPAVSAVRVADEEPRLPDFRATVSALEVREIQPEKKTSVQTSAVRVLPEAGTVKPAVKSRFSFDYGQAVVFAGIIWLAGMAFMLGRLVYGLIFLRGFNFGLRAVRDTRFDVMLRNAAGRFGQKKSPLMFTSPRVESPITVGISKPVVIIPEKLLGHLSDDEMKSILMHELAHIYSCDHLAGVFKRIVIAANWWNPLVYMISNEHSAAREEVADSYALLELHPKVYSECLVGLAEKTCLINSFPATAGMAGKYSSLEQRIRNILSNKRTQIVKTGKRIRLAAVLSCGVLALAVAGIQAASADEKPAQVEKGQDKTSEIRTVSISEKEIKTFLKILPKYEGNPQPDMEALRKESGMDNDFEFHSWMEKMIAGFGIFCEEKSTLIGMNKKYKDVKLTDESRILIEKYYPEFRKIGEDMLDKQLAASSKEVKTLSISESEIKTFLKILPKFLRNPSDMETLRKESGLKDDIEFHLWMAKVMTGFGICSLKKNAPILLKITTVKDAMLTDESRILLEKYYPEFEKIGQQFLPKPKEKAKVGPAKPIEPSKEMDEAIRKALVLEFNRYDNSLLLKTGIKNAPVNVAFTVYGKREGGSDEWGAVSSFSRDAGGSTEHVSSGYKLFTGLSGGTYRFKFKYVPNKEVAEGKVCPVDTYYGGDVETDWISLTVPPLDPTPAGLKDTSTFAVVYDSETVRNDGLFQKEWPSFKIQPTFGKEYRPGNLAHIKTSPVTYYDPSKMYASAFRIVELSSTDAQGKTRVIYNVSCFKLFHSTGFPIYGLDQLFPVPGEYTLKGKIYFFSMSGSDMIAEKLAVVAADKKGLAVGAGVYNPDKALETLEKLQKKYPFHSLDLPESKITAFEK